MGRLTRRVTEAVPTPGPRHLSPAAASAQFESRRTQLELLLTAPDFKASPALRAALASPEVRSVLLGATATAKLPLPPGAKEPEVAALKANLQVLTERLSALTGQPLSVRAEAGALSVVNIRPEPDLEAIASVRLKDAWQAPERPQDVHAAPARELDRNSLRVMSMIAYCASPGDLASLASVLESHEKNFADFGFRKGEDPTKATRAMTVLVTDDSPPELGKQVQALTERLTKASTLGTRYLYLGGEREAAFHQAVVDAAVGSPKAKACVARGELRPEEITRALSSLFGSGAGDGVGRNRNNAMLAGQALANALPEKEGRGRFFQVDHDQQLAALDGNAQLREARLLGLDGPASAPNVALEADTLGAMEARLDQGALATANFTGGKDRAINDIVLTPAPLTEAGLVGQNPDDWLAGPQALTMVGERPDTVTRSATAFSPRGAVWASATRNQDIELGDLYGNEQLRDSAWVLHREQAGSKWGSPAKLLWDDLASNATMSVGAYALEGGHASADADAAGLEQRGRTMLARLASAGPSWQGIDGQLDGALEVAAKFVDQAKGQLAEVDQLTRDLDAGGPRAAEAVSRWIHGKPLAELSGLKRAACAKPDLARRARTGLDEARARLKGQVDDMQRRFPAGGRERLRAELVAQATANTRNLAISYLFAPEIAEGAKRGLAALGAD